MFLLTAQVIISPKLRLWLTVLMLNLRQGGTGCRLDPSLFPLPHHSLCPSELKVFVFSAHVFGSGAQKQSAELCRGPIKLKKLKEFVIKFLSDQHHSLHLFLFPPLIPAVCTFRFEVKYAVQIAAI